MTCSRCKVTKYCSADCQRTHWPEHKKSCVKFETKPAEPQADPLFVKENDCTDLVQIIRTQFIDIPKVIAFVDPSKAADFKKRNADAYAKKGLKAGSCGHTTSNSQYHIEPADMNSVDKALNQMISTPHFIRQNLKVLLERTEQAYQTIVLKGQ
jgi:hypothetical protein